MTLPVFIVGSGRNGTELIYRLLREYDEAHSHHEYQVHAIQPLACKWVMGLASDMETEWETRRIYEPAIIHEDRRLWTNSCNKASWIISQLDKIFPEAKFVHLVRDGRRVVSSFYHKLADECYADKDVEKLRLWSLGKLSTLPNEKRYWWSIPSDDDGTNYDQFKRICWHWKTVNLSIMNQLSTVAKRRQLNIKLEDFVSDSKTFSSFFKFLGLTPRPELFEQAQRPVNVRSPVSCTLSDKQREVFFEVCGPMMKTLGYTGDDYEVKYRRETPTKQELVYSY